MKQSFFRVIILLLCLGLLAGCSVTDISLNKPTPAEPDETQNWPEGLLMTVNGEETDYREVLLYLLAAREEAELLYGEGIWDKVLDEKGTTYGQLRKEQILQEIIDLKTVTSHEKDYAGTVVIDQEDNSSIENYVAEFTANVGRDRLLANNISAEIIRKTYRDNILATKIYEAITLSVDTNVTDAEARQSTLQYIFKSKYTTTEAGEKVLLEADALAALNDKMKSIYETAKSKSNFLSYAQLNTEAASVQMTVGAGDLPASISQIVLSLSDNELSPVLETEEGFYIFKCVKAFDEDATLAKKEVILQERQKAKFDRIFESWKENVTIVIHREKWESLKP